MNPNFDESESEPVPPTSSSIAPARILIAAADTPQRGVWEAQLSAMGHAVCVVTGDKGVSAGERSEVTAADVHGEEVALAVASKDASLLRIENSRFEGVQKVGYAAFQKKPEYGPARIVATGVVMSGAIYPHIIQTGSEALVDGRALPTQEVDVAAMYEQQILGN